MFLNCASEFALIFRTLSESADLNFSSFNWPRLMRTFNAAPSIHARVASAPTPTSEMEAGFPFSAISASNAYDFDAVSITFKGTSAACFVATSIAAQRAVFSSADTFGSANASITLLKAALSSSTSDSNSSLSRCALTAQLLKYSSFSSQPRFPAERFATIPPNDAPNAPIKAATEPPPGAGESLNVSLQKSRTSIFTRDFFDSAD